MLLYVNKAVFFVISLLFIYLYCFCRDPAHFPTSSVWWRRAPYRMLAGHRHQHQRGGVRQASVRRYPLQDTSREPRLTRHFQVLGTRHSASKWLCNTAPFLKQSCFQTCACWAYCAIFKSKLIQKCIIFLVLYLKYSVPARPFKFYTERIRALEHKKQSFRESLRTLKKKVQEPHLIARSSITFMIVTQK